MSDFRKWSERNYIFLFSSDSFLLSGQPKAADDFRGLKSDGLKVHHGCQFKSTLGCLACSILTLQVHATLTSVITEHF